MASKFRQDMPPEGGYGPVDWAKKLPKTGMSGYAIFGTVFAINGIAIALYVLERKIKRKQELETTDARIALQPFILAERHRMFLSQLRKNRDDENELMKDVPGWETGTYYGTPVYHNLANRFNEVTPPEYFAHAPWKTMYDRLYEKRKH